MARLSAGEADRTVAARGWRRGQEGDEEEEEEEEEEAEDEDDEEDEDEDEEDEDDEDEDDEDKEERQDDEDTKDAEDDEDDEEGQEDEDDEDQDDGDHHRKQHQCGHKGADADAAAATHSPFENSIIVSSPLLFLSAILNSICRQRTRDFSARPVLPTCAHARQRRVTSHSANDISHLAIRAVVSSSSVSVPAWSGTQIWDSS